MKLLSIITVLFISSAHSQEGLETSISGDALTTSTAVAAAVVIGGGIISSVAPSFTTSKVTDALTSTVLSPVKLLSSTSSSATSMAEAKKISGDYIRGQYLDVQTLLALGNSNSNTLEDFMAFFGAKTHEEKIAVSKAIKLQRRKYSKLISSETSDETAWEFFKDAHKAYAKEMGII